jgi:hypothetical protein
MQSLKAEEKIWQIETDHSPIVARALHCGYEINAYLFK